MAEAVIVNSCRSYPFDLDSDIVLKMTSVLF